MTEKDATASPPSEPTVRYSKRKRNAQRKALRMDAYLRYSSKGDRDVEGEKFQSLREQHEKIETWEESRSVTIVQWHEDSAVSGGKMRRPAFDRMMARIRSGETDGVVVARLDRFSRAKPSEAMDVVEELQRRGAVLAALDIEGCDPTTSTGELVMNTMLSISRFYRKQAGERYGDARGRAVRDRHLYIASSTPVGYVRVTRDGEPVGPNARATRLEEHPVEGAIIRELFERRAQGESWMSLRDWLQSTSVRPQSKRSKVPDGEGGMVTTELPRAATWGVNTVKRLVEKTVYLGTVGDEHGGVYVDAAHPALTDRATFTAAQARSRPRQAKGGPRSPLQGLVYCAGCSYKMGLQGQTRHQGPYFFCNRHRNAKDCPAPGAIAADSDRRARLNGRYSAGVDPEAPISTWGLVDYVTEAMFARAGDMRAVAYGEDDQLAELRPEHDRAVARLDDFLDDDATRASISAETWQRRVARLQATIDALDAEIARIELTTTRPLLDMTAPDLREAVTSSLEDHHSALSTMVRGVFVRAAGQARRGASPARVHVVWFDEEMPPVPRHGPNGGIGFPRRFAFPALDIPASTRAVAR